MLKQSKSEIPHCVNRYELLSDILDSDTDDVETLADKPLTREKDRKNNRKRSSQKVNGDDKSQVTTILGDSIRS